MNLKKTLLGIGIVFSMVLCFLSYHANGNTMDLSESELSNIRAGGWMQRCNGTTACPTSDDSVCEGVTCVQKTWPSAYCKTDPENTKCASAGTQKTCKFALCLNCDADGGSNACGNLVRAKCPQTAGGICAGGCIQEYTETPCKKDCS